MTLDKLLGGARLLLSLLWLAGQAYILRYPQLPMFQRPLHLLLALALVLLWMPLGGGRRGPGPRRLLDGALLLGVVACGVYFVASVTRLTERMETIDPVFPTDVAFGLLTALILLECVRRTVGWSLLGVILAFLVYAFAGPWFPGWLSFQGLGLLEFIEVLTMTVHGVLGITTQTSLQYVFYFVAFGAFYAAVGGSRLFIDLGLRAVGRQTGGAAKAAVISSSMFGTISGSAVANVMATGVFTIPLMRRVGFSRPMAGAVEAIASTGGQLMPPIMGIAAFVMAEILQVPYARVALAGAIPAIAYYAALFMTVDLYARRSGIGTLRGADLAGHPPILPRLYLLAPPVILVALLVVGYSATYAAALATASCPVVGWFRRESRLTLEGLRAAVEDTARQACQVAVPIAAIGIIIAVAIQSNLAIKFSTGLIQASGGRMLGAMLMTILGCIVMGMGLPTVAAYIIGAILFVPALLKLGIPELAAHFFVMYYSVLSMVTPPVALASYAAAGLAEANPMRTGLIAFRMSLVTFLVPFAFAFDESLLARGSATTVLLALPSLAVGTAAWAVALEGHLNGPLNLFARALFGAAGMAVILAPTRTAAWAGGLAAVAALCAWAFWLRPHLGAALKAAAKKHGG